MGNGIVHMLYDKVYSPHAMEGSLTLTVALVSIIAVGGRLIYQYLTIHDDTAKFPLINGAKPWSLFAHKEKMNFIHNAPKLFEQGLKTAGGIFRLQTDDGIQLILSGDHAESLRNHPDLSFTAKTALDFHATIPGFDAFLEGTSEHRILQTTITNYLTHNTHNLNHFLSEEATNALQVHWGDKPEWTDVAVKDTVLHIITQVASRAFLGPELCRNQAWVEHVSSYGSNAGLASQILRVFPKVLRPVVHWFIPACRALRQDLSKCREIVLPVLAKRKREKQERIAAGLKPEKYTDAMEWFEVVAKGRPYDAAAMQIMLAAVGAHSSADAMAQVVFDLADKPELVEEMRQEILEVMPTGEWTKQNIYNLKLMDSVLKESQRLKPATMAPMHRAAVRDTVLPDGTRMVKGSKLMISGHQSMDGNVYPDVDKFDGHRFLRLRNEGLPTAQFVSTSPCTMGFGHGGQACPGRFFANAELKIALAHMLLKYDFKVKTVARPPVFQVSLLNLANPTENIMVRRREEEISM